jgi:hypothetical protein
MKKLIVTTRNFNDKAKLYLEKKAEGEIIDATMKGLKDAFLRFLRLHGVRPEDAPKSRKYESDLYESLFSVGRKTEINEDAVRTFEAALESHGLGHLSHLIFESETRHSIADTASETVKQIPMALRRAYVKTQSTKPKPPALKVAAKKQPPTKKELAEQEAAHA